MFPIQNNVLFGLRQLELDNPLHIVVENTRRLSEILVTLDVETSRYEGVQEVTYESL